MTDLQRKAKQHIRALLLEKHLPEPPELDIGSQRAVSALKELKTDPDTRLTLQSLRRKLEFLGQERRRVDEVVSVCLSKVQKQRIRYLQ